RGRLRRQRPARPAEEHGRRPGLHGQLPQGLRLEEGPALRSGHRQLRRHRAMEQGNGVPADDRRAREEDPRLGTGRWPGGAMERRKVTIAVEKEVSVSGLLARPRDARACLVLADGAGAGMAHPFLAAIAEGLAERKVAVLRYNFPYMERK